MGWTKDSFLAVARQQGGPGQYQVYIESNAPDREVVIGRATQSIRGSFFHAAADLQQSKAFVACFEPANKRDADSFADACKKNGLTVVEGPQLTQ
ncbi:MAG: hypothetical protein ACXW4B_11780 [Micavibrio sp.]